MSAPKSKRKSLTIKQKLDVLEAYDSNPEKKQAEIASLVGIAPSSLRTILAGRDRIEEASRLSKYGPERKRFRTAKYDKVETALLAWIHQARSKNVQITGPVLQSKAASFSRQFGYSADDFKCSSGWLIRFKDRHSTIFSQIRGGASIVGDEWVFLWLSQTLPEILTQYKPCDIYNADEIGLLWRFLPDQTLTEKAQTYSDGKKSKERITILLCANMDGSDKLPLLVIGKSAKPKCFENVKHLPVNYESQKKSWMTSHHFTEWLVKFDKTMGQNGRKVCLVVDNCAAHLPFHGLKHITLHFLPPNTMENLQPCNQGIIEIFKSFYRKRLLEKLLHIINRGASLENVHKKISFLDTLHMIHAAWSQVSKETVAACFHDAGFVCAQLALRKHQDHDYLGTCSTDEDSMQLDDAEHVKIEHHIPVVSHAEEHTCRLGVAEIPQSLDIMERLSATGFPVANVTFEDYVHVDDNLSISEKLTDAEIVENIKSTADDAHEKDDDSVDDGEEPELAPTLTEALNSISCIRRFWESDKANPDYVDEAFYGLNRLEEMVLQSRAVTASPKKGKAF